MADMKRIKGRIAETIYPNGTGAITAESHQALLLEMVDTINREKADQSALTALEDKVDNLPTGGGNFNSSGVYPDLTAGDLAGRGESVPAQFGFRASGGKSIKDGRAYIKRIKGNSVVWNQLADSWHKTEIKAANFSYYDDYAETNLWYGYDPIRINMNMSARNGHKILLLLAYQNESDSPWMNLEIAGTFTDSFVSSQDVCKFYVVNVGENDTNYITFYPKEDQGYVKLSHLRVYDLTLMYGAGNEPTTIEDFNARVATLGIDMYAYNEGQVIHCNTESIKSVGDNAWDEQWELGIISNGENYELEGYIRSKNYIPIIGGEDYHYANRDNNASDYLQMFFYDEHKVLIDSYSWSIGTFPTPINARYMRFYINDTFGTTYKNDIMIRLDHSGWKSETGVGYEPYWQDTLPLPIIRKYFPDGMKLAGSAHDEIRFNKASGKWEKVEAIGIREYQEGDADNAAYLTDGKVTCYPLAEPIVTEITEDFRDYYNVADFGTEQAIADTPSAPFSADIIYQFNAVDMIREHEAEITELQKVIATMQAQLTSLINGGQ